MRPSLENAAMTSASPATTASYISVESKLVFSEKRRPYASRRVRHSGLPKNS